MSLYEGVFQVGDTVTPIRKIKFIDKTTHEIGQLYVITERELAYYEQMKEDYRLIQKGFM